MTTGNDWVDLLQADVLERVGERQTWDTPLQLAQAVDPSFVARQHLVYLAGRLAQAVRDVEAGVSRFLSVSMPPRLGKSFLTSVWFPAWALHKHPSWELMLLSHDPSLAAGWGRQIRRLVETHGPMLDLGIALDAGAAKEWEVERPSLRGDRDGQVQRNGVVLSRSIRESITGRGAKVMVLDDIVKDFADAHSKASREFVWDWWTSNSRTRLHPPALVVAIGTRWHEDDFIGRLLSSEYDGDPAQWEVISFPALAEDPEAVDPRTKVPYGPDALGRKPGEPLLSPLDPKETKAQALDRWADVRQAVGSYAWAALYQQAPSPPAGAIFDGDWWQYWEAPGDLPEFDRMLTSWDCAFKGTDSSDFVVGQLWGAAGSSRYLLRQVRRRMTFTETVAEMRTFISDCREWTKDGEGVHEHLVEDKANGTAVIDTLTSEIPGLVPVNPTDSKEARARAVSPVVEARNVFLPRRWEGLLDYLSEHKAFPNAAHDDQVDCTTQALHRLRSVSATVVHTPLGNINRGYQRSSGVGGGTRRRT